MHSMEAVNTCGQTLLKLLVFLFMMGELWVSFISIKLPVKSHIPDEGEL